MDPVAAPGGTKLITMGVMSRAGISPSADVLPTPDPLPSDQSAARASANPPRTGGERPRAVRWAVWLSAGIAFGLLVGFVAGLSRPRQSPRTADPRATDDPSATDEPGGNA